MAKQLQQRKKRSQKELTEDVSADDVIKQMLALFHHLGVDGKRLAAELSDSEIAAIASKRNYPHFAAIGELLTSWHQDPNFLDAFGNPLPLKMHGARRSFASLAKKSVPKINPKHLLAELEGIGAVATDSKNIVTAQMRSLPVFGDRRLATQHTLTSLHSFIRTLRHNLSSPPSNRNQLFHRVALNGAFDPRDMPALKIKVKRHAQSFLELMDDWMVKRPPRKRKSKPSQVAIGVYLSVDRE